MNEEFDLWVKSLVYEGYDLSDYTWDEMYDIYEDIIYEETEKEREARLAARRARVKEMQSQGRVMTSSRRASERARERRQESAREAREKELRRLASGVLASLGHTGKVSDKPMGSESPTKEAAPEATRILNPRLRRDNLGSAADRLLRDIRREG